MKQRIRKLYAGQERFLRKSGAMFWLPWLSEERYFLLRIGTALLCGVCGVGLGRLLELPCVAVGTGFIFGLVLGYFLPMIAFQVSDKRDNEQMMSDIRKLYEYVKIQVKAGMYLTNTLSACYLAISNRRLKQGLLELNSRLVATNSLSLAMADFEEKFTNEYIGYFCLIIKQSEQSGRMAQMLEDMTRQMTDMERYMMKQKKGRMERRVLLLTLLVFVGIILIAAYELTISLMTSVTGIIG